MIAPPPGRSRSTPVFSFWRRVSRRRLRARCVKSIIFRRPCRPGGGRHFATTRSDYGPSSFVGDPRRQAHACSPPNSGAFLERTITWPCRVSNRLVHAAIIVAANRHGLPAIPPAGTPRRHDRGRMQRPPVVAAAFCRRRSRRSAWLHRGSRGHPAVQQAGRRRDGRYRRWSGQAPARGWEARP